MIMNAMMESEVLRLITNREIRSDVEAILIVRFLDVLVTHTTTTDDEAFSPGVNFINMLMISFYEGKRCGAQLLFHQQNYAQLYQ